MNGLDLLTAAALALANTAAAQPFTPRTEYEQLMERPKPMPEIPAGLRSILSAPSPDRLLVRNLHGRDIPVDIEWYEPEEFTLLHDGRYLGFAFQSYEDFGYLLIDRAAEGEAAVIATGEAPLFSPDRRHFASVQISAAGYGNLEGIALWETRPGATVRLFFSDVVPLGEDWRLDGWARADCAALSAIPFDWQPDAGQDWDEAVRQAPRSHYRLELDAGGGVALNMASGDGSPCAVADVE